MWENQQGKQAKLDEVMELMGRLDVRDLDSLLNTIGVMCVKRVTTEVSFIKTAPRQTDYKNDVNEQITVNIQSGNTGVNMPKRLPEPQEKEILMTEENTTSQFSQKFWKGNGTKDSNRPRKPPVPMTPEMKDRFYGKGNW